MPRSNKNYLLLIQPLLILSATSCTATQQSILNAPKQTIIIETVDVQGASCKITDSKGNKTRVQSTPDTVLVTRGYPPLTIICQKNRYKDSIDIITGVEYRTDEIENNYELITAKIQDPYSNPYVFYPIKISIFMEKKNWRSEAEYQDWTKRKEAYAKSVADEKLAIQKARDDIVKQEEQEKIERRQKYQVKKVNNPFIDPAQKTTPTILGETKKAGSIVTDWFKNLLQ